MRNPLVSVIVPTRNSSAILELCLDSIKRQTYEHIELVVVDRDSTDATKAIANRYTDKVLNYGPERSAQVNYGVRKAKGAFVYKVDSDFILDPNVIKECVDKASDGFDAVVVHNTPDTRISWIAKIRKFEVDMYKYDITHSSARFVRKSAYEKIGGFDPAITAGEDYDFQNKLSRAGYKTGFIDAEALHLGEPKKLWPHLKKYHDYGKDFVRYRAANKQESGSQLSFLRSVYRKHWKQFIRHPLMAFAFMGYNTLKYMAGGTGYLVGRLKGKEYGETGN